MKVDILVILVMMITRKSNPHTTIFSYVKVVPTKISHDRSVLLRMHLPVPESAFGVLRMSRGTVAGSFVGTGLCKIRKRSIWSGGLELSLFWILCRFPGLRIGSASVTVQPPLVRPPGVAPVRHPRTC